MNINEIKSEIVKMHNSKEYLQLMNYYSTESFFKTLRISREEKVHSNFLSWLLNPASDHELGLIPIKKFLQTIALVKEEPRNSNIYIPEDLIEQFLIGAENLLETSSVQTEVATGKIKGYSKTGRIDLLLHLRFNHSSKSLPILIENKVLSTENIGDDENQTEKYLAWSISEYSDKEKFFEPIYIFLAPDYDKNIVCSSDAFLKMSYQNLVNYFIEPCYMLSSNSQAKFLIENYLRCLSNSDLSDIHNRKESKVMAFSNNEKELLQKFYTANKNLFDNVLAVLANDDDMSDEDRRKMRSALDITSGRDYSKYLFDGKSYGKGRCVLAVVKHLTKIKGIKTFAELKELFPDELQGTTNGVIKKVSEIRENAKCRYYLKNDEIIHLDAEIAVSTQWGVDNFPNILNLAQKHGLIITKQ